MSFNYDLFVIGAGSGGVRAARVAAEHGAKVAIAEGDRCGGTCVIRGCVPKKLMVFASEFSQVSEMAKGYGWNFEPTRFDQFDWSAFHKKRAAEISRLEGVYQRILRDKGVERFDRNAKITGPNEVELSSGEKYTAKYILIATGAQPVVPKDVVGAEHSITSNDIFDLPELPESLLIIGAGYIACEFACILHNLGARVQMWIRSNKILSAFDHEATSVIKDSMARSGIEMEYSRRVTKIVKEADGKLTVTDNNGTESKFSKVFFATGRSPNVSNLGLESVGIKLDRAGAIVVDEFSQTACPSIYAVGDVTNRMNLTPVAIREAMAFVNTVFKGVPTRMDYTCIPSAVFTQPELGTVGLSEEAARALGPIEIYKSTFNPMRTAFAGVQASVFLKLVVCKNTRVVLGCHIVAPQAGELIQMIAIAVKMRVTKEMFDSTVGVHPTLSEEIVTLRTPSE